MMEDNHNEKGPAPAGTLPSSICPRSFSSDEEESARTMLRRNNHNNGTEGEGVNNVLEGGGRLRTQDDDEEQEKEKGDEEATTLLQERQQLLERILFRSSARSSDGDEEEKDEVQLVDDEEILKTRAKLCTPSNIDEAKQDGDDEGDCTTSSSHCLNGREEKTSITARANTRPASTTTTSDQLLFPSSSMGEEELILRDVTPGAIAVSTGDGSSSIHLNSLIYHQDDDDVELGIRQPHHNDSSSGGNNDDVLGASNGTSCSGNTETTPTTTVTAVTVDDDIAEIEERVRNHILQEAIQACAVLVVHQQGPPSSCASDAEAAEANAEEGGDLEEAKQEPKCMKKPSLLHKKVQLSRCAVLMLLLLMMMVIGAAIGIAVVVSLKTNEDQEDPAPSSGSTHDLKKKKPKSTLDLVRERGFVRCGLYGDSNGFSSFDESTGQLEGFNIDQCRAISLAVFGTPHQIEPVIVSSSDRFWKLANRSMDVLTQTVTHTMGRDIYEPSAKVGFTFSTPYFYSGMGFGGTPDMVSCAESLARQQQQYATASVQERGGVSKGFSEEQSNASSSVVPEGCNDLKVCVLIGTTQVPLVKKILPDDIPIVITMSIPDSMNKFVYGQCNVFAGEPVTMSEYKLRKMGYDGPYEVGTQLFSREPLTLVTNDEEDNPEWSALIDTIVNIFFVAEANGMTKSNAHNFYLQDTEDEIDSNKNKKKPEGRSDLEVLAATIVSELGNYAEMYERHLQVMVPRSGLNTLYHEQDGNAMLTTNTGGGLLYSFPFGDLDEVGPGPIEGKTLDTILKRGYLKCGIKSKRPRFAIQEQRRINDHDDDVSSSWSGIDVDFCRGIAAAIFGDGVGTTDDSEAQPQEPDVTSSSRVVFVDLSDDEDTDDSSSYYHYYNSLMSDDVDVVAGARVTLEAVSGYHYYNSKEATSTTTTTKDHHHHASTTTSPVTFSPSYFYYHNHNSTSSPSSSRSHDGGWFHDGGDSIAMATSGKDPQWSSFVYWTVMTIIYAEEEQGVVRMATSTSPEPLSQEHSKETQEHSSSHYYKSLPVVNLFGDHFRYMLQNVIKVVGSYNEIYNRNFLLPLEKGSSGDEDSSHHAAVAPDGGGLLLLPRSGSNRLNNGNGPQQYPMPLI